MERERQNDVSEAVRIVYEVAERLDYAHRLDVVHRDVKPENILLADGHAQIADFGLALATSGTTSGKLTDSGIAVGTPHYVSPEQGAGARDVDKRSDVYSLGCVLYELLTGSPPFTGVTPQQIVAQHMTAPVPSLRLRRPGIAPRIERAVLKALAKTPADRFRTALAFSEACSGDSRPSTWWRDASEFLSGTLRTPRGVAAATVVALSATTVWGLTREGATRTSVDNASFASATPAGVPREAEPTRYAIVGGSGRNAESLDDVAQLLHDALRRWSGITILGNQEVRDALSRVPGGPTAGQAAQRAAMALSADYYVRLAVSRSGDSLGVRATLFEARSNSALKDGSVRIAPTLRGAGPAMNMLADSLLFREGVPPLRVEPTVGTRSLRARQAYARGHTALEDWDLARADAEFFAATREDAQYAQAFLWLAQVRSWLGRPVTSWEFAAEHAAARGDELAERERILSRALLSLARGERHKACPLWGQLTDHDPTDFAAWYAWGNCLRSDDAVVVDPRSPSGWRFRTSYHTALRAYRRAFQLRPAIHRSFAGGSLDDIRRLLVTGSNAVRQGRAVRPDTTRFSAYPSWQGDTLAFIPVPLQEFASLDASSSESRNIATRRQRELFQEIASMWRAAYPHSVDAIEAVAVALDLLGNSSALDTLQFARRRAADIDDRVRMGGLEVWMRVKSAAPSNVARLRTAARLADSLLSHHTPADAREAKLFASLAALLGRATQAARYGRMAAARTAPPDRPIPVAIAETAPALVAFAALGGPVDSVRTLEALVIRSIGNDVEDTDRDIVRAEWLFRSAILAVPTHRSPVISELARSGSMTGKLLQAWSVGDLARARQLLAALRDYRRQSSIRPPDITLDGLYPEAAAMASLGDARAAIEWLDPTLDSLAFMAPQSLADVARAGPFVRAMVLRAELADRVNDRTKARTWAHAVTILWSHPDEFLKPTLSRMRSLAR